MLSIKNSKAKHILYVILPYFNYCKYEKRLTLFTDFVKRYWNLINVRIVVVEGSYDKFELPTFGNNVIIHIKVKLVNRIWIKENLINLGIKYLPENWKYVAWIDADLTFLNTNWVHDTMQLLDDHDIVQLFHTAINMGPNGEALKIDNSFCYMSLKSGKPYHRAAKYGFWHPGFAWSMRRSAYEQLGGLLDIAILGSGDRHMALSLIGKADWSYHGGIDDSYKNKVLAFQEKCKNLTYNYTPGTILHHFHGSLKDRKYVDRWLILVNHKYNPTEDTYYDDNGVLNLTTSGKRLQQDILEYFIGRKEDGTEA
jgi:hypothetical protein